MDREVLTVFGLLFAGIVCGGASLYRVSRGRDGRLSFWLCIGGIALICASGFAWIFSPLSSDTQSPVLRLTMMPTWTFFMLSVTPLLKLRLQRTGKAFSLWALGLTGALGYTISQMLDAPLRNAFHVTTIMGAAMTYCGVVVGLYLLLYLAVRALVMPFSLAERAIENRVFPRSFGVRLVCAGVGVAAFETASYFFPTDNAALPCAAFLTLIFTGTILMLNEEIYAAPQKAV